MEKTKKVTDYQLEKNRLIELLLPQYCEGDDAITEDELRKLSLKQLKELNY